MAELKIYNMNAEVVGNRTLADDLFAVEYNEPLIHEVVVAYNANQRQGTKSTLTRSEVRGHAAKPYRQKGTGRARQGSTKGPQFTGGGVVFAPKPRDFSKKVNKNAKRIALLSALSKKIADGEVVLLDKFELAQVKTKEAQKFLDAFKFNGTVVVVNDKNTMDLVKATRNISTLSLVNMDLLNVYDVVANKTVVLTESAIKKLEEAYEI
ncbi:MAG: 50S ribosomal protein L4 [Candidatus Gastranaerophilales bacterium]|nr:50S ribosomal protein L4 [Clostridia bacterium]MBQ8886728.1 50S ribosomal protein L4 [Candidatus Gastranaerophilales bacterium]